MNHVLLLTILRNFRGKNKKFKIDIYAIIFILRIYFRGIKREEWVAPIPGLPCFTGLYVTENSPK